MNKDQESNKPVEIIRVKVPSNSLISCCSSNPRIRSQQLMFQNHSEFKRSAVPDRFMFLEQGSWIDFCDSAFQILRSSFLERKPIVEVSIDGSRFLFDFLRMMRIEFTTGDRNSIAWIDVNGKCYFPKLFVDEKILDGDSVKRKRDELEDVEERTGQRQRCDDDDVESARWPNSKLLKEGDGSYSVVKDLFLSGMREVDSGVKITAIHQCLRDGVLGRARWEAFQKQCEIVKATRGVSNTMFAWYGASIEGIRSLLSYGFGKPSTISGSEARGIGVYLWAAHASHLSSMSLGVDDNGEKHVVLCRLTGGNFEKIEAGSQQFHPSSEDFDTGVDDIKNPKCYTVWCANMNTHVFPECVVSFKSSDRVLGQARGSAFMKRVPNALNSWVPNASNSWVVKLFSKLERALPSSKVKELKTLCRTYKAGMVARSIFIKQLRTVTGDGMLLSAIREIRRSR